MLRLQAGCAHAQIISGSDEDRAWVEEFLTFRTKTWVRGKPRESVKSYLGYKGRFPVGLAPMVARHARDAGLSVDVEDCRPAVPPDGDTSLGWLRDYQREAVERCVSRTRGVVSSPTGSGKGEMITALLMRKSCRWLVLVHRDHLVADLGARFEKRSGEQPGWIRSGMVDVFPRVVFATFQSFRKRLQAGMGLPQIAGVIVDEAHTVAADTFRECVAALTDTYYRFGFSGTPFDRTDARSIAVVAAVGPKIYTIKSQFLIDRGYVPRPVIRMLPCVQDGTDHAKYATVYRHTVEESRARNSVCLSILEAMEKPGIAFVRKRGHGLALAKLAEKRGMNVTYVDGRMSRQQRETAVTDARRGAIDVLMSTVVFQEGLDLPELRSVANLAGGQSVIEILQRLGRGMRKDHDDDHTFQVWDVFDVVRRAKGSRRQKWLQKHSQARAAAMAREGHTVTIHTPNGDHIYDPDKRLDWLVDEIVP